MAPQSPPRPVKRTVGGASSDVTEPAPLPGVGTFSPPTHQGEIEMRVRMMMKTAALPLSALAFPALLLAQTTNPETPGTPPEVPGAPRPGESPMTPSPGVPVPPDNPTSPQPTPETPATPSPSETPPPATPATPADPANPSMPGPASPATPAMPADPSMPSTPATPPMPGSPPAGEATPGPGGIRWAPMAQIPAPAPQAEYPPCTRELQDQCTNTRRGADTPRRKRPTRG